MITATGRTFEHRDLLKSMGGQWDNTLKVWTFNRLTNLDKVKLRSLVGVMITEQPTKPPMTLAELDAHDLAERLADLDRLLDANAERAALLAEPRPVIVRKSSLYGDDQTYHNHFADQNPRAFFGFSSLSAFVKYVQGLPTEQQHDSNRTGWNESYEFSGSYSMDHTMRIIREGWPEGVEQASELIDRLLLDNPRVRRRKPAMAGGSVNVGRMLSGDPAHMIAHPKQPGKKVVTFFVEIGLPGSISTENMINRAAIIAAMIDLMENVGYSCTVVAVDTSLHIHDPFYQLTVTLKHSGERLNLADIIFGLGHPSFLRRMSFATLCSVGETRTLWGSQGSASNSFDDDHRCASNEFYVPVFDDDHQSLLTSDPLSMLPYVTPATLPIKIGTRE